MSRDTTKLHPVLQIKIKELQDACEKKGLKIGIAETLRTVAEQDALYAKGRTAPGPKVTNAKGSTFSSMHQWGVAFDFYRNDKKGAYNDSDGFFEKVGAIGKSLGLEWGGDFKTLKDRPHFQLKDWGSTPSKLKRLYKTPDNFMKLWEKTPEKAETKPQSYPTLRYGSESEYVKKLQQILNQNGYNCGKVDGIYGNKTREAVMAWQVDHKDQNGQPLSVDGIVGPKSWASLLK